MRPESRWSGMRRMTFVVGAVTLFVSAGVSAQASRPQGQGVSAVEALQLPKFCWSNYLDVKGPEYQITGCGPGVNHYCEGLVELLRANKNFSNTHVRLAHLHRARYATIVTIGGIKGSPACPIRSHVEGTRQQIDAALRVHGIK